MAQDILKKRKGNVNCCVVNCSISFKNSPPGTHFYTFPISAHKKERREKWIHLVNRRSPDGTLWQPSKHSRICSQHFVGNQKSENPLSPSYNPTIFPEVYKKRSVNKDAVMKRYKRSKLLVNKKKTTFETKNSQTTPQINFNCNQHFKQENNTSDKIMIDIKQENNTCDKIMIDKSVEANFLFEKSQICDSKIFICNRFIFSTHSEAEVQAFIPDVPHEILNLIKRTKNKNVGTDQTYISKGIGPDREDLNENGLLKCTSGFYEVSSIKSEPENDSFSWCYA